MRIPTLKENSTRLSPFVLKQFELMIPEIRRHAQSSLGRCGTGESSLEVRSIVAHALVIYTQLVQMGLRELAYPKPLAMAAMAELDQAQYSNPAQCDASSFQLQMS